MHIQTIHQKKYLTIHQKKYLITQTALLNGTEYRSVIVKFLNHCPGFAHSKQTEARKETDITL